MIYFYSDTPVHILCSTRYQIRLDKVGCTDKKISSVELWRFGFIFDYPLVIGIVDIETFNMAAGAADIG